MKKIKKELVNFLIENQIDINKVDIDLLIESGWWDRNKQGLKRGLQKGALLAAPTGPPNTAPAAVCGFTIKNSLI